MRGRPFIVLFEDISVAAPQDLFEILCPTDSFIEIVDWHVFQNSDYADAEAEILRLEIVRGVGSVTSGSGGSTATPQPGSDGDPASGATVEINNTTRMLAGSGSLEIMGPFEYNVMQGPHEVALPEWRDEISPGNRWTLALDDTPADALIMSGFVKYNEHGG